LTLSCDTAYSAKPVALSLEPVHVLECPSANDLAPAKLANQGKRLIPSYSDRERALADLELASEADAQ
jgi:hypothetical protein